MAPKAYNTDRLPPELRDRVDAHAEKDYRSRQAEIIVLLTEACDARDAAAQHSPPSREQPPEAVGQ